MRLLISLFFAGVVMCIAFVQRLSAMPGTYYDPTVAYGSGGLDRETGQNYPAALYQRLMDMLEFITGGSGTWTTFTPTLTQNGGAVACTVNRARYAIVGKTAIVQLRLASTAAGAAGIIRVASIPAAIAPADTDAGGGVSVAGVGVFGDASTSNYYDLAAAFDTTSTLWFWHGTAVAAGKFGVAPAITLASGDLLGLQLCYEIA